MHNREIDVVAIGACYVDTNVANFPFERSNLMNEELIGDAYEVVPGGSAVNFCRLSSRLGLKTAFIGTTGKDANSDTLEKLLSLEGVLPALIKNEDLQTNIGYNITNPQGDHIMFVAGTANAALAPEAAAPKLAELLPKSDILYLGGCLKLKSFIHAFKDIAQLAKQHNTTIAVDHGRVPQNVSHETLEAVRGLVLDADYYFPSRDEFYMLWDVSDIDTGLRKLQQYAPSLTTIVKDGANGAFYIEGDTVRQIMATSVDTVVNATGAGDSFNAGVLAALGKYHALPESIAFGCKVAGAKISATDLPKLTENPNR